LIIYFQDFTVAAGKLFFAANDGVHGFELRMIPGVRLERGGHHHGGDDDGDGEHRHDGDGGHGNAASDALTSRAPSVAIDRTRRGVPSATGGACGPCLPRPRVLQDLTAGQRPSSRPRV
jgi:hypothetical protein